MSTTALTDEDLELETYCQCFGSKKDCQYCHGEGTVATRFGEKVLEFILKHTDAKIKEST